MITVMIDPCTVIGGCLETAFDLPGYIYLIENVKTGNAFSIDEFPVFKKKYNAFYRVRQRSQDWYNTYYRLMQEQKNVNRSFEQILRELLSFNKLEVSFASKLISTVDPDRPIWDQYVLKSLNLFDGWVQCPEKNTEDRIQKAVQLYDEIEQWYKIFLNSQIGKDCVKRFNEVLPGYASRITDVKKIDYFLTSMR